MSVMGNNRINILRLAVIAALVLSLGGCLSAPDLSALSQDPAPICLRITSIYGTAEASRYHGCDLTALAATAGK